MQILEFYIFLMKAKSELCRFKRCAFTEQMFACAFRVPGTAVGPGGRDTRDQTDPDLVHMAIMFQWGRHSKPNKYSSAMRENKRRAQVTEGAESVGGWRGGGG